MRILFLNHNTKGRGTYQRCIGLAAGLVKQGHDVTLVTSSPHKKYGVEAEEISGVKVLAMPELVPRRMRNGGLGPLDVLLRSAHIARGQYEVVHGFDHRPTVSIPSLIAKYVRHQTFISEWTDWWGWGGIMDERPAWARRVFGELETSAESALRRRADGLTVICSGLQQRAREAGVQCPVLRLPGGADIENLRPIPKEEARRRIGLKSDGPIIAYSGFTQYDRAFLLESFAALSQQHKTVRLLLIGPPQSDVQSHPAADRIIQAGPFYDTQFQLHLCSADVLLLPFRNRGVNLGRWPNKVGDYMAVGRPIVANRTGDLIKVFEGDSIGLLSDDSVEGFTAMTGKLLADAAMAGQMGATARGAAERKYSWYALSKDLSGFYDEVLSRN